MLLVTKQTGTSFNAGRKSLTALSHIPWVLYLPRQYFSVKGSLDTALLHISEFYIDQKQNGIQKHKCQRL